MQVLMQKMESDDTSTEADLSYQRLPEVKTQL